MIPYAGCAQKCHESQYIWAKRLEAHIRASESGCSQPYEHVATPERTTVFVLTAFVLKCANQILRRLWGRVSETRR
jgi:hypothetical protein